MTTTTTPHDQRVRDLIAASPDWLQTLRTEAWERYQSLPYPEGREEVWRFTDVAAFRPDDFDPAPTEEATSEPPEITETFDLAGTHTSGRAVHLGAKTARVELSQEAKDKGVTFVPIGEAVNTHADILRPRLGSLIGPDDPHRAFSLAAFEGGMFLHVPSGIELHEPIQAVHWIGSPGIHVPRTVVVVEPGSRVIFNDVSTSGRLDSTTLALPTIEVFCGRDSRVGWLTWQDHSPDVRHLAHVKAHLDQGARLDTLLVTLGGSQSRTWKECTLAGEGAESYMFGLYFPHGEQRVEHWTVQDHVAPNTTSDLLYKGALADNSQALYYGTIRVRPDARRTDAYQANRNLALSPHARALPNPQLEIENNDVRCTHGATVGQIDDEMLFYLRSRGVSVEDAKRLIVFGFFNEVLERVEWSGMHEQLAEAIRRKMETAK